MEAGSVLRSGGEAHVSGVDGVVCWWIHTKFTLQSLWAFLRHAVESNVRCQALSTLTTSRSVRSACRTNRRFYVSRTLRGHGSVDHAFWGHALSESLQNGGCQRSCCDARGSAERVPTGSLRVWVVALQDSWAQFELVPFVHFFSSSTPCVLYLLQTSVRGVDMFGQRCLR